MDRITVALPPKERTNKSLSLAAFKKDLREEARKVALAAREKARKVALAAREKASEEARKEALTKPRLNQHVQYILETLEAYIARKALEKALAEQSLIQQTTREEWLAVEKKKEEQEEKALKEKNENRRKKEKKKRKKERNRNRDEFVVNAIRPDGTKRRFGDDTRECQIINTRKQYNEWIARFSKFRSIRNNCHLKGKTEEEVVKIIWNLLIKIKKLGKDQEKMLIRGRWRKLYFLLLRINNKLF